MPGPWIDAHCHLADARFDEELEWVIERSRAGGVTGWIQGGVDPADWARQKALRIRIGDGFHQTFGLHPWWTAVAAPADIGPALAALEAELGFAVGLGELGLDKTKRRIGSFEQQLDVFEAQLEIGRRRAMPLVLHVVSAHAEALAALEHTGPFALGGLVHSFSGSAAEGLRYVELGFHLSLSGGRLAREARTPELCRLPVEKILVETDAPDQLPAGWMPPVNEPANLLRIADALAPAWGLTGAALLDSSRAAALRLFGISP